jgi:hypothetical protein
MFNANALSSPSAESASPITPPASQTP